MMNALVRTMTLFLGVVWLLLFVTWVFGIRLAIRGFPLEQEPLLILPAAVASALLYWRRPGSPHRLAVRFLRFLEEQGLGARSRSPAMLLLMSVRHWLTSFGDVRYELLSSLSASALPEAQSRVALLLFLRDESSLRERACREAADDAAAVRLVYAYLEFREERRSEDLPEGARGVPLDWLFSHAPDRLSAREKELGRGFNRELACVREILERGEWPWSLGLVLSAKYDPARAQGVVLSLQWLLAARPSLKRALRRLFTMLPAAVVERYLASHQSNAYLLTFRSPPQGNMAGYLNALSNEANRSALGTVGIKRHTFEHYTTNARIGLVPSDTTLKDYAARLQKDVGDMIAHPPAGLVDGNPQPPVGTEVLLHRLGLSGRDYYHIQVPYGNQKAIATLGMLLAHSLEPPDLLAVIESWKDPNRLVDAILDGPLSDLAGPLAPDEEDGLVANDGTLRAALLHGLAAPTINALAARLGMRDVTPEDVHAVVGVWKTALAPSGAWQPLDARLQAIATTVLETLRDLALLKY